ncbi:hypothetical protein LEN26_000689 [Aphanomyces euteiches]|nr:hypothetical protein LEN26_000689 [Aphanomyces euteiches]
MASAMATKRLRKEYLALLKNPEANIEAVPLEKNILEWHYVIRGIGPYEGGYYHGKLKFPPEYPMKPPAVFMLTQNGRFQTNKRLCLSMSDYHPETWNPMWSVSSILAGLFSFMNETTPTLGSIVTTDAQKRKYAASSLEENCRDPIFVACFPELVELHKKREQAKLEAGQNAENEPSLTSENEKGFSLLRLEDLNVSIFAAFTIIVVFVAIIVLQP